MSKVNFVNEFNLFMRYARNNGLSLRERMLWIALFHIANDRAIYNEQTQEYDWPEGLFFVSHGELYSFCCLDKRSIETLRNSLKQRGLIDFKPGPFASTTAIREAKILQPPTRLITCRSMLGAKMYPTMYPAMYPTHPPTVYLTMRPTVYPTMYPANSPLYVNIN